MAKKIIKKTPVTLEEIAILMRQGFTNADEKLSAIEAKFKELEGEFDDVYEEVGYRAEQLGSRLDTLEKIIHEEYRARIIRLEERIKTLETDFRARIAKK